MQNEDKTRPDIEELTKNIKATFMADKERDDGYITVPQATIKATMAELGVNEAEAEMASRVSFTYCDALATLAKNGIMPVTMCEYVIIEAAERLRMHYKNTKQ